MGTPEFAVAPLDALIEKGYDIVGVVTVPDKPSGRGLKLNESAVKQYAVSKGLKIMQPVSLKDEAFLDELASLGADLFIVVAFRMLPKVVWSMPKMGTFNLHGSLLPKYRGGAPIQKSIINGETETGITIMYMAPKMDAGDIIAQKPYQGKTRRSARTRKDSPPCRIRKLLRFIIRKIPRVYNTGYFLFSFFSVSTG